MTMKLRRKLAIAMIVLGALVMLLAPSGTTGGLVLIALGVILEITGVVIERNA